jgi:hypothetical protein
MRLNSPPHPKFEDSAQTIDTINLPNNFYQILLLSLSETSAYIEGLGSIGP